jgi:hypothetical protein
MDGLSLASDESMILTMQDIISHGVRIEVILTSKRLILVESGKDRVHHEDIQFENIGSVVAGENAHREPTITLTTTSPPDEPQTVELIFFRRPGIERTGERDQLIAKLKGYISSSLVHEPHIVHPLSGQGAGAILPGTPPGETLATLHQGRDWTPRYIPYSNGSPASDDPSVGLKFNTITVFIIILVVVVGGALIYSQFTKGKTAGPSGAAAIPTITTQATAGLTPSPTVQPASTLQVTERASSVPQDITKSGIWVRVQYPGSFIGSVGNKGGLRQVNASGDKFYQIPMRDGIIDVSIQKQEGSGDELAVEIYKDGSLVKRSNTTAPKGTIDLHITL